MRRVLVDAPWRSSPHLLLPSSPDLLLDLTPILFFMMARPPKARPPRPVFAPCRPVCRHAAAGAT